MSFHIDKRPTTLDQFVGNEGIKESLFSVLTREQDKPHVMLFIGPRGCGKTTLARIYATMAGCNSDAIYEYNMAQTNGIDTIREITENSQFGPLSGKNKMYILDEAHCMTKGNQGAQNALLKVLEPPPKHVYFALCTTEPDKLLDTVISRCMKFEVKSLPSPLMTKFLIDTIKSEGITDFPTSVINEIVKNAEGCPRNALVLLDSVIDIMNEDDALRAISEASATKSASIELCRLLIDTRENRWKDIQAILPNLPDDAEGLRYSIMGYMQKIIWNPKSSPETIKRAIEINDCFSENFMYTKMPGLTNACYYASKV